MARTGRRDRAPLYPAGHLPHKGGDRQLARHRSLFNVDDWRDRPRRPISPLVGEMSGRTEGARRNASLTPSDFWLRRLHV
ncbi:lytic murein transglycosylase [Mesorhizobium sp. M00.F.Ca.ET.186.01.1.1]|nr:lytic murein transglycosylase [bacterium M00.F.Ca.ET.205.01.1.1]TGU51047.1 lytic murein transglycosylase [bacterium M00.F.Ca.ET.152.01.1.1]TGV34542.1 lytic murein transglycosylase [Mesorhizobium sp. M00.F.Ca.ET.186.01.1.1]TGZ42162.1 lytic murein transglycosylase [bacterium M00.F.Ca.ET.162.01.1.1]